MPLHHGYRPQFHFRTLELSGEVELPLAGSLFPGENGTIQVRLDLPAALLPGQRFAIRESGRTLAVGRVFALLGVD